MEKPLNLSITDVQKRPKSARILESHAKEYLRKAKRLFRLAKLAGGPPQAWMHHINSVFRRRGCFLVIEEKPIETDSKFKIPKTTSPAPH